MADIACPICKRPVKQEGNPHFPFCTERCKLIDLGRWLGGKYQIPVERDDEDESTQGMNRDDQGR